MSPTYQANWRSIATRSLDKCFGDLEVFEKVSNWPTNKARRPVIHGFTICYRFL